MEGTLNVMADEHVRIHYRTQPAGYQKVKRQEYLRDRGAYLQKVGEIPHMCLHDNRTVSIQTIVG